MYLGAVETGNPQEYGKPNSQETKPRSGTLILWQRAFLATERVAPDYEASVQRALDSVLMNLVNDFAEGK